MPLAAIADASSETSTPGATALAAVRDVARGIDPVLLYVAGFGFALVTVVLLIRWLRARAPALGLMDEPDAAHGGRHAHAAPAAKVGGIAIVLAIGVGEILMGGFAGLDAVFPRQAASLHVVLLGTAAMAALGLWDDLKELSPGAKAALQAAIAATVFWGGVRFTGFTVPGFGDVEFAPAAAFLLTVLWFVAITNAFNLVDGADGVAGSAALCAAATMLVVALVLDQPLVGLVLALTTGAVLGFLYFNFPPASVFLGDAGSLSLGFLLAGLGLVSSSKATTVLAIAIPVVSLGLPILDTALAIVRRFLRGGRVTGADLGHIHHRLQALGHSPRRVALLVFAACGCLSLASLIFLSPSLRAVGLTLLVVGLIAFLCVQRLHVPELLELRRVVGRGFQQREVIARNVAIRDAVSAIRSATDTAAIAQQFGRALEHAGCERAELWLAREFVEGLATGTESPHLIPADGGYVWKWDANADGDNGAAGNGSSGDGAARNGAAARNGSAAAHGNENGAVHANGNGGRRLRLRRRTNGNGHSPARNGNGNGHANGHGHVWEMVMPFADPDTGMTAARLKVWRPAELYMPPELRLVTEELLPEAFGAAGRLASQVPVEPFAPDLAPVLAMRVARA